MKFCRMVGIVQWQNARLWLWMSWVRPPLPTPIFNNLAALRSALRSVKRKSNNPRMRLLHFIGDDITVNVHGGPDVGMSHQFLLNRNRGTHSVKPRAVAVAHCVRSQGANASVLSRFLKSVQNAGV
jgi:hypothetical protein